MKLFTPKSEGFDFEDWPTNEEIGEYLNLPETPYLEKSSEWQYCRAIPTGLKDYAGPATLYHGKYLIAFYTEEGLKYIDSFFSAWEVDQMATYLWRTKDPNHRLASTAGNICRTFRRWEKAGGDHPIEIRGFPGLGQRYYSPKGPPKMMIDFIPWDEEDTKEYLKTYPIVDSLQAEEERNEEIERKVSRITKMKALVIVQKYTRKDGSTFFGGWTKLNYISADDMVDNKKGLVAGKRYSIRPIGVTIPQKEGCYRFESKNAWVDERPTYEEKLIIRAKDATFTYLKPLHVFAKEEKDLSVKDENLPF